MESNFIRRISLFMFRIHGTPIRDFITLHIQYQHQKVAFARNLTLHISYGFGNANTTNKKIPVRHQTHRDFCWLIAVG